MIYAYHKSDELYHHGIKGQEWGEKNGPPYPLDAEDHSAAERKALGESIKKYRQSNNIKDKNRNHKQFKRNLKKLSKTVISKEDQTEMAVRNSSYENAKRELQETMKIQTNKNNSAALKKELSKKQKDLDSAQRYRMEYINGLTNKIIGQYSDADIKSVKEEITSEFDTNWKEYKNIPLSTAIYLGTVNAAAKAASNYSTYERKDYYKNGKQWYMSKNRKKYS